MNQDKGRYPALTYPSHSCSHLHTVSDEGKVHRNLIVFVRTVSWNNLPWCLAAAGVKQQRQRETAGYEALAPSHSLGWSQGTGSVWDLHWTHLKSTTLYEAPEQHFITDRHCEQVNLLCNKKICAGWGRKKGIEGKERGGLKENLLGSVKGRSMDYMYSRLLSHECLQGRFGAINTTLPLTGKT